ncbi:MAG: hypothetical protein WBQ73_03430, partial [Candidatus Babeliales bacterium]
MLYFNDYVRSMIYNMCILVWGVTSCLYGAECGLKFSFSTEPLCAYDERGTTLYLGASCPGNKEMSLVMVHTLYNKSYDLAPEVIKAVDPKNPAQKLTQPNPLYNAAIKSIQIIHTHDIEGNKLVVISEEKPGSLYFFERPSNRTPTLI